MSRKRFGARFVKICLDYVDLEQSRLKGPRWMQKEIWGSVVNV